MEIKLSVESKVPSTTREDPEWYEIELSLLNESESIVDMRSLLLDASSESYSFESEHGKELPIEIPIASSIGNEEETSFRVRVFGEEFDDPVTIKVLDRNSGEVFETTEIQL